MQKKLTITVDEKVYGGLHFFIGRRRISQFVESLVRPHVVGKELEAAYAQMAQDESREKEALELSEATIGDSWDYSSKRNSFKLTAHLRNHWGVALV